MGEAGMTPLRKFAEGQPCLVRLPGCDGGGATTVLAHIRRGGVAGMGQKPPDVCGVWACFRCHQIIDKREFLPGMSQAELDTYILEGLCRTLSAISRILKL